MADESESDVRSTLIGVAVAGGVAMLILFLLNAINVGSPGIRIGVAVIFGVVAGQVYERLIE